MKHIITVFAAVFLLTSCQKTPFYVEGTDGQKYQYYRGVALTGETVRSIVRDELHATFAPVITETTTVAQVIVAEVSATFEKIDEEMMTASRLGYSIDGIIRLFKQRYGERCIDNYFEWLRNGKRNSDVELTPSVIEALGWK